jgi:hypothetical protein
MSHTIQEIAAIADDISPLQVYCVAAVLAGKMTPEQALYTSRMWTGTFDELRDAVLKVAQMEWENAAEMGKIFGDRVPMEP